MVGRKGDSGCQPAPSCFCFLCYFFRFFVSFVILFYFFFFVVNKKVKESFNMIFWLQNKRDVHLSELLGIVEKYYVMNSCNKFDRSLIFSFQY